jgi:hypothetical protein
VTALGKTLDPKVAAILRMVKAGRMSTHAAREALAKLGVRDVDSALTQRPQGTVRT